MFLKYHFYTIDGFLSRIFEKLHALTESLLETYYLYIESFNILQIPNYTH